MDDKKRGSQIQRSTVWSLVLVIVFFICCNIAVGGSVIDRKGYSRSVLYGFPFPAVSCEYWCYRMASGHLGPPRYTGSKILKKGLLGDLLIPCGLLAWIYWLREIRRDRHTRKKPYRRAVTS